MPHEVLVFGGGSQKYEDAAECFQDAGKMFVLAKSFDEAGKAYLRAAEMFEKTKSDFDTGSVLTRAGEAFQKAQDLTTVCGRIQEGGGRLRGRGQGQHGRERLQEARRAHRAG